VAEGSSQGALGFVAANRAQSLRRRLADTGPVIAQRDRESRNSRGAANRRQGTHGGFFELGVPVSDGAGQRFDSVRAEATQCVHSGNPDGSGILVARAGCLRRNAGERRNGASRAQDAKSTGGRHTHTSIGVVKQPHEER
jgi:hypothetical protein